MSRGRRGRRSNLIRRVIDGEEAEEEVVGQVYDEAVEELLEVLRGDRIAEADLQSSGLARARISDVPSEILVDGGDGIMPRSMGDRPVAHYDGDDPVDIHQPDVDGVQRETVYIRDGNEAVLLIAWGNERFTVRFPLKADAPAPFHDLPVGRIEWIVEERIEDDE